MNQKSVDPVIDTCELEKQLWKEGFRNVMGLDEVGRGCLAGPVVAAGVILDPGHIVPGITDSKKLKADRREEIAIQIRKYAKCWTIAWCNNDEIDATNILRASLKAMAECVGKASTEPDFLLVDGNKGLDSLMIRSQTVVKGDGRSVSIGAASILAKVYRDNLMRKLHRHYPEFGWDRNAGYPTRHHYEALKRFGYTPCHRLSFQLRTVRRYRKP